MDPNQAPEVVPHQGPQPYYQNDEKILSTPVAEGAPRQDQKKKKIMGLHRSTFWLLIILTVVVIAAAIGGGVGGSLAVENARSKSDSGSNRKSESDKVTATTSSRSTTTSLFLAPTEALLPYECEGDSDEFQVDWLSRRRRFNLTCESDRGGGDTASFKAYSMDDCATACIEFMRWNGEESCVGFVFHWNLTLRMSNCFLKNSSWNGVTISEGSLVAELK